MEKMYKTMRNAGTYGIISGIVILVTGIAVGTLSIICGSVLLKRKSEILF